MHFSQRSQNFIILLILSSFQLSSAWSAALSVHGNYRFIGNTFQDLKLSTEDLPGKKYSQNWVDHRLLISPDVLIDDRFYLRSEINVIDQNAQDTTTHAPEAFGSTFGGLSKSSLHSPTIRRAWMEWMSDYGIFRAGRMPKSWGLGILFNPGTEPLDDFGSTADRVSYEALVGNLRIVAGYDKEQEGVVASDSDDIDNYEVSVDFSDSEKLTTTGLLFSKSIRGATSGSLLHSSNNLSVFTRRTWGRWTSGGELVIIGEEGRYTSTGLLAKVDWNKTPSFKMGFDFAFASASANSHFEMHPNYKPFLILYNQSLGPDRYSNEIRGGYTGYGVGSTVGRGSGAGALLSKLSAQYTFQSPAHVLGFDFGYASLVRNQDNPGRSLGVEFDSHFKQVWTESFHTGYAVGVLFPGHAFGTHSSFGWGVQALGTLVF